MLTEGENTSAESKKRLKWLWPVILVGVALLLELLVFNFRWIQSMGYQRYDAPLTISEGLEPLGNNRYRYTGGDASIELQALYRPVKNVYAAIGLVQDQPLAVTVQATDYANSAYFNLPKRELLRSEPKSQYLPLHLAGDSEKLRLNLSLTIDAEVEIQGVYINCPVPLFFSLPRFLLVLGGLLLLYLLRPSSGLYRVKFSIGSYRQTAVMLAAAALNMLLFAFLSFSNPIFTDVKWSHHQQYQKLAEALADGQAYLHEEPPAELSEMENPYNPSERNAVLNAAGKSAAWDTAYYNGKYYVYFGIVPELIFYFPYYLLTGNGFPTYIGIFLAGTALIYGVFFLFRQLIRRWFPQTPFLVYMLLCLVCINGCGALWIMADPVFYSIPVITALALTAWGLCLWLMALNRLSPPEPAMEAHAVKKGAGWLLGGGSLCMALVAGCRPQMVMGSFLAVPFFYACAVKGRTLFSKTSWKQTLSFCLPYVVVAAGLMYYNAIRFGSPFDFGAAYNLTTNDMVSRGFQMERIPLGLFMYLFQPPVLGASFPFVQPVSFSTNYMGLTIQEAMYGGVMACSPILLSWFGARYTRTRLKEKKLWGMVWLCALSALAIIIADTQMAGILPRYINDFAWLLFLGAALILLTLYEGIQTDKGRRAFYAFVLIASILTVLFYLLFSLSPRNMLNQSRPDLYYHIKHLVMFWL